MNEADKTRYIANLMAWGVMTNGIGERRRLCSIHSGATIEPYNENPNGLAQFGEIFLKHQQVMDLFPYEEVQTQESILDAIIEMTGGEV